VSFGGFFNDLMRRWLWLPEQASTFATRVDYLHYFVVTVTMISSLLVGILAFVFFFRYRERRRFASTPLVVPSHRFEAVVIVVPLVFFLLWGVVGFRDYIWSTQPPKDAMDIYVMGKKWMWKFTYPDGGPNANSTLHVPADRPVRLLITSRDVIHSFFIPEFRVKMDAVPGRYTETWFQATKPGRYRIYCTEFCGTWHSQMVGDVVVLPPAEFDRWLASQREGLADRVDTSGPSGPEGDEFRGSLLAYGRRVASAHGCLKCHSVDGTPHIGPTWVDLYRRSTPLETGETIIADEGYLTESMMDPPAKLVKGYQPIMPSFRGRMSAPEAAALVEYIKSLRGDALVNTPPEEPTYGPVQRR
jgi:cytochrome c oxidase subunit II